MFKRVLTLTGFVTALSFLAGAEPNTWPVELETGRFKVYSDFAMNSQNSLLPEMDSVCRDLENLIGNSPQRDPVHVIMFATEAEYSRYMQTYFPGLPKRRALFIQDRGPGMLFTHWHKNLATDLRHELTHALLNQRSRSIPLWLDEGLAEYFEVPAPARFRGNPYCETVRELTAKDAVQSIEQLSTRSQIADFSDAHYRDSWAWVHFLIHRKAETRNLLMRYLSDATLQQDTLFSFTRSLRAVCPDLEREFVEHFETL